MPYSWDWHDGGYGGSHDHVIAGVFAAMEETLYWTASARFGEHATTATPGPTALAFDGDVKVGKPFVVEAQVVADQGDVKDLRARLVQAGGPLGETRAPGPASAFGGRNRRPRPRPAPSSRT